MENVENRVLFYDSEYTGHHYDYIMHLLTYLTTFNDENTCFFFVLNEKVVEKLCEKSILSSFRIIPIENQFELGNPTGFDGFKRVKKEVTCVNYYCMNLKIDKCFLLNINPFILITVFPWLKFKCKHILGIHFHPYYRLVCNGHKEKIKFHLKAEMLRAFATRKDIQRIFILNDSFVCNKLNSQFKLKDKFSPLADPISVDAQVKVINASPKNLKKKLLFWGYINKRKGIDTALDAICLMKPHERNQMDILIAGKIDEKYKLSLIKKLEMTRKSCPEIEIELTEGFVKNEDIARLISDSDLIMAPYTKMEGSSGLLGWAAAFEKPILGPKGGLIGELIEQFKLGICVDTNDIDSILDGLRKYINTDFIVKREGQEAYLKLNSPKSFSENILNSLLNEKTTNSDFC